MHLLSGLIAALAAATASATVLKSLHPTLKPFGLLRADDADFYTAAGFYKTRQGRTIVSFKLDPKTGVAATGYYGPLTLRPVGADTWFLTLPLKEKAQPGDIRGNFTLSKSGRFQNKVAPRGIWSVCGGDGAYEVYYSLEPVSSGCISNITLVAHTE